MRCAVFGAGGGIGAALVRALLSRDDVARVYAGSRADDLSDTARCEGFRFDLLDEGSIREAASQIAAHGPIDRIFVATGILQDLPLVRPERSWASIDPDAFARVFALNATGPALVAKHMLPHLAPGGRFAALSARVGSIGDNRLGGWHAYRASKAALNMLVRNFAIELRRKDPEAVAVALHPGTVDTGLSRPFQGSVAPDRLFEADRAASQMVAVLEGLEPADSGGFFAWDGRSIEF